MGNVAPLVDEVHHACMVTVSPIRKRRLAHVLAVARSMGAWRAWIERAGAGSARVTSWIERLPIPKPTPTPQGDVPRQSGVKGKSGMIFHLHPRTHPMISTHASTVVKFGSDDRVECNLRNWQRWVQSGNEVRGLPSRSLVVSGGGCSQQFDDMADASDRQTARVVDVLVTSLDSPRRSAVDARYLGARFQYQTDSFAALLGEARAAVGRGLAVRGVW